MTAQDLAMDGLNLVLKNALGILIVCGGLWVAYKIYEEYVKLKEKERE